ncbi:ATP-binding cassette domain-containing protein [Gemmatimonadota bacterium]
MDALFLADSVGIAFGTTVVLKAGTAWAQPGRITVLLGRNGCGKSTLLRAALGLGPMDYGVVKFDGRIQSRPHLSVMAREGLYFLPDRGSMARGRTLRWHLKALHRQRGKVHGVGHAEELGLGELLDQAPFEMSGGEERKAELALALSVEPRCLLADEPLYGISPMDQDTVASGIRRMAENGCAVLVTGHEVDPLLAMADQVIWMAAGTTHGLGTPQQAREHFQFGREYLGPRGGELHPR